MLEREPNHYDELKKAHEAALEKAKRDVAREKEVQLQADKSKTANDIEAHMAAFEKELDVRVELGRISRNDKIYLLRAEESRVATLAASNPGQTLEFPKPKVDPERMLTDKEYRREVYREEREARQIARNGARGKQGPNRSDSDERGRFL